MVLPEGNGAVMGLWESLMREKKRAKRETQGVCDNCKDYNQIRAEHVPCFAFFSEEQPSVSTH